MSDLLRALSMAKIQRALLRDVPGGLYGDEMDRAHDAGLIERYKWASVKGRRTYRAFVRRTELWAQAAIAIADARRSQNMSVDPLEVGPHSERKETRSYRQWRSVWPEGESVTSLRKVAEIAAAALTPESNHE